MNWVLAGQTNVLGRRFATALTARPPGSGPAFTPAALFASGEQGVWYDPSDLTTMFQDSAGTTPVGTPGNGSAQPVGLLLDKHSGGVGTNGAARYNILSYTSDFTNGVWTKGNLTITSNAATAPDGTSTATKFTPTTASAGHYCGQSVASSSATYQCLIYLKAAGYNYAGLSDNTTGQAVINLTTGAVVSTDSGITAVTPVDAGNGWWRVAITWTGSGRGLGVDVWSDASKTTFAGDGTKGIYVWGPDCRLNSQAALTPISQPITSSWAATMAGNHATQSTSAARPTLSALYNILVATDTLSTQSVTTVAATYTLSFSGSGTITLSGTKTGTYSSGSNSLTGVTAGTLTLTVSGTVTNADLRVTNDGVGLPVYQRVVDANTYDSTGFPYYLKSDGVDDQMATASIDFTGTQNVTVFHGIRKLTDSGSVGVFTELSSDFNTINGTFICVAPEYNSVANSYTWAARGTTIQRNQVTNYTPPATKVTTGIGSISSPQVTLRFNGTQVATNTSSLGTGNFSNNPLYIFARSDKSAPFNGRIFGLIVRGVSSTATDITNTETWMNTKTAAY